ncbi:MAG: hypothetical protein HYZ37_03435 [Candidatus Solibacter usitatus]|nr:hypothetical protein [Candidatus Solibacter usitatus]
MSVWQGAAPSVDLLAVRITVEAFQLEELLEVLADAPFPINPSIEHHTEMQVNGRSVAAVLVTFPAWESQFAEVRLRLEERRLAAVVDAAPMLGTARVQ